MQPAGSRAIDGPATGVKGRPHAVRQRASFAGIGKVDDVRVIRVIGDVLDSDELEDVVGVRPVLQRLLRRDLGCAARDVLGHGDELSAPRIADVDLVIVVRAVEGVRGIVEVALIGGGHAEAVERALVRP